MSNVMAFIRWKKISTKPPKKNGREGKAGGAGGGASGGGDDGTTPRATPTPGGGGGRGVFGRKTRPLLPKQLPEFAGRKQVFAWYLCCCSWCSCRKKRDLSVVGAAAVL